MGDSSRSGKRAVSFEFGHSYLRTEEGSNSNLILCVMQTHPLALLNLSGL